MNERNQHERQRGPSAGCLAVGALLALPCYVLSIGPAHWLDNRGYLPDWAAYVFAPIDVACLYLPVFAQALDWYVSLWR